MTFVITANKSVIEKEIKPNISPLVLSFASHTRLNIRALLETISEAKDHVEEGLSSSSKAWMEC